MRANRSFPLPVFLAVVVSGVVAMAACQPSGPADREFLEENLAREGVEATDSGLQYEVIEEGDGPRPEADDVVRVHYRGTTIDGEVFDESYSRGQPATFPLERVISGWTEGLQLMRVGSTYKFYVPSDLAYGENPPPGVPFGPGATLIFEVELLEIIDNPHGEGDQPGGGQGGQVDRDD